MAAVPLEQGSAIVIDSGIRWNALLALAIVLLCTIQGVLAQESAVGSRLSYRKLRSMILLQCIIISAAFAAELDSFVRLRIALNDNLKWLQWEAPCLLIIGCLQMLIDIYVTLAACSVSRVFWRPIPVMFQIYPRGLSAVIRTLQTLLLAASASFALILVGWRKHWWMNAKVIVSPSANGTDKILSNEGAISGGVEAVCIGFSLFIVMATIISITNFECKALLGMGGGNDSQGIIKILPHMAHPNNWTTSSKLRANIVSREPTTEHFRVYRLLHEVRHAEDQGISVSRESQVENLSRAPLHVGNAVIGPDLSAVLFLRRGISQNLLLIIIFVYHVTIFPILISVTIATVRVYKNLNIDTLKALNEFVDAVIVLALVEVGIGLKTFLWASAYTSRVHPNDRGPDDF